MNGLFFITILEHIHQLVYMFKAGKLLGKYFEIMKHVAGLILRENSDNFQCSKRM